MKTSELITLAALGVVSWLAWRSLGGQPGGLMNATGTTGPVRVPMWNALNAAPSSPTDDGTGYAPQGYSWGTGWDGSRVLLPSGALT